MTEDDTGSRGGSDGNGGEHDSRKCGMASTRGDGRGDGMGCKATVNVLKAGSSVAYGEAQANVLWELAALSRRLQTSGESERSLCCVSVIGASNS